MPPAKPPQEALADILRLQQKAQEQTFKQVGEHLQARLAALPELQRLKDQVTIEMTEDGLRIELLDKEGSSFFEVGSAQFKSETHPGVARYCQRNPHVCPMRLSSKATRIVGRSRSARTVRTGNCRPIGPTAPGVSWKVSMGRLSRSRTCAATPTASSAILTSPMMCAIGASVLPSSTIRERQAPALDSVK